MAKIEIEKIIIDAFYDLKLPENDLKELEKHCKIEKDFCKTLSESQREKYYELDNFRCLRFSHQEDKLVAFTLDFVRAIYNKKRRS